MTKKRRPTPKLQKRVSRNPYERTLEHALNRRGRAMAEYAKYRERIASLEIELPRLEQIISILTPMPETANVTPPPPVGRDASRRSPMDLSTPEGRQRYMDNFKKKAGLRGTNPDVFIVDETAGLDTDDNLPNLTGDEILP